MDKRKVFILIFLCFLATISLCKGKETYLLNSLLLIYQKRVFQAKNTQRRNLNSLKRKIGNSLDNQRHLQKKTELHEEKRTHLFPNKLTRNLFAPWSRGLAGFVNLTGRGSFSVFPISSRTHKKMIKCRRNVSKSKL